MKSLVILATLVGLVLAQDDTCSEKFVQLGKSAYFLERNKFNWWDSSRRCMALGSQLAHIDSEEELNAVSTYLNQLGFSAEEGVWFSGFGIKSGAWISIANSRILSYFKWGPSEPNDYASSENCLGLKVNSGNWSMYDLSCFKENAYLCENVSQ
ncbi:C-type lectin 37Db [Drosophila biarmipes]|uniref:C-type lectin 37Db n=1 Tax=Drosophila biarmipes TaxID=125945 RepID=UPI0007E7BEC5|nr:C-type lectin 37Db [Drosophila biarmipes]